MDGMHGLEKDTAEVVHVHETDYVKIGPGNDERVFSITCMPVIGDKNFVE